MLWDRFHPEIKPLFKTLEPRKMLFLTLFFLGESRDILAPLENEARPVRLALKALLVRRESPDPQGPKDLKEIPENGAKQVPLVRKVFPVKPVLPARRARRDLKGIRLRTRISPKISWPF